MKVSWMMLLAAAFAGPLATGCWMAATPFCGLTTVAIVTSLGPILTAIFGRFFLHEKLNARIYLGIIIVIAGAIVAGYSGASGAGSNFILGIILAFMAPIDSPLRDSSPHLWETSLTRMWAADSSDASALVSSD